MILFKENAVDAPLFASLGKSRYYDSPEGTQPWHKVWGMSKWVLPATSTITIIDSLFHSRTRNIIETANVAAFWGIPLLGLTATFASVAFIGAHIRGKDDNYNYIAASLATAPILRAWCKSTENTCWGVAIITACAVIKKECDAAGWDLMQEGVRYEGNHIWDFSLTKEWPRRPY